MLFFEKMIERDMNYGGYERNKNLEYCFAILETVLKLIYVIVLVLISGLIWGWYNNLPVAVLVLMTIGIFVVCVCLDAISLISEVKSINELIEGEEARRADSE